MDTHAAFFQLQVKPLADTVEVAPEKTFYKNSVPDASTLAPSVAK